MLVTLSFANDAHAAAVQLHLADRGLSSVTLFVDRLWRADSLQSGWRNGHTFPTVDDQFNECLDQPFALWLRRPSFYVHSLPNTEKGLFARQEWRVALDWLIAQLSGAAVATLNPWDSLRLARNKPAQLQAAEELGFNVPNTLISNSRSEIARFVAEFPSVCKSFSPYAEGNGVDQRVFYTRRLSLADVNELDPVLGVPLIVQERIEKAYEIRAAFVDGRAYCLKIPAEYEQSGSVDWREQRFASLQCEEMELQPETLVRCQKLLNHFSLTTASIDLIVDPQERIWFLEFNEQGNFLFVDRAHGRSSVLDAFGDLIASKLGKGDKKATACAPEAMLDRVRDLFRREADSNSFYRRLECVH
ncbi:MAG TPA: hypothetical protein VFQ67_00590 [Allosphingosinicella sp.]|jgi:glutathione synthase/RimK-type ligase-like ATP-grasp enzyme|nr:hypothetical protein [Allosphingosinicella sp.]